jgi:heme/copper-type cytochrome/quinol oxidase subunit 3
VDHTAAATFPAGQAPVRVLHGAAHGHGEEPTTGIPHDKLGMWVFLCSEIMFFTGLIGAYIVLRFGTPNWPHPGGTLNIWLTAGNTFLLICSSVTMVQALASIQRGDTRKLRGSCGSFSA